MSGSSEKQDERALFDDGTFSKLEKLADSDITNLARQFSVEQRQARTVDGREAESAAGYTKTGDGRHVVADGLVSRGGKRRIIPGRTREEETRLEQELSKLHQAAHRVLYGEYRQVFERLAIHQASVDDVAAELRLPKRRIYKIFETCKEKIKRAMEGGPQPLTQFRLLRSETVREYINDTEYFEFRVGYWADGDTTWSIISHPPAKETVREPMEKWKTEESDRMGKIRKQIELQRAARSKKGKSDEK